MTNDMGKFEKNLETFRKTICKPCFSFQEWGGEGLGRLKRKHGEGFGLPMLPKDGVGRV